jgi:hypothetical protein
MRIAAYKASTKCLGEFASIKDAARILGLEEALIGKSATGKIKCVRSLDPRVRKLGWISFREIDPASSGRC